jgi:hypothetical protein
VALADSVQADRLTARVVVEADAVAEQDRRDVQVDLVDQSQFEKLAADVGREDFEVLAACRFQPDADGLGRVAWQERRPVWRSSGILRTGTPATPQSHRAATNPGLLAALDR